MSYQPNEFTNRLLVSNKARFRTVKSAVDWFNVNATDNTEILIDAGQYQITDTIIINNPSYKLTIRGAGSGSTHILAGTGLTGKPMIEAKSDFDIDNLMADGSNLANYGTLANENFITFSTTSNTYNEITDIIINKFKIGLADWIGCGIFLYNFIIRNCGVGVEINYATTGILTSLIDAEVGNFESCTVGISLKKAFIADFILDNLVFIHTASETAVLYDGANFNYNDTAQLFGSSYNNIGTFLSGFDFANVRDANIEIEGNTGTENKSAHAKINVINNVSGTTITTGGVYYKANFTNTNTYTCKMTLANNKMTYLSHHNKDCKSYIGGSIAVDTNNRNLDVCLHRFIPITSIIGNGATTTVTTTSPHMMSTGSQVQLIGWTGGTGTWNGIKLIIVTGTNTFTFVGTGNGTATGGTLGNLIAPLTVRCTTSGQPYPFILICYIDGVYLNEYFELFVTSPNSNDIVTVSDISWLFESM